MATARVDKLAKAVAQLEANLEINDSTPKKNQNAEKVRILCTEIKDLIVSSDFNLIYKEDHRYAESVSRSIQTVFRLLNHSDQNTRTFAEEMLDSILRSLLLGFHQYRVLVCLISEISRNGAARSLVAAYIRLANLVHLSKTNRVISYGVHISNALASMLKRPEESVQQAIVQHSPAIFNTIGPRMKDHQIEKIFGLYQIAAENLELTGTANRAAVVVISQICSHYTSILQKAFVRCYTNVRMPDEFEFKSRLVGSLNTLKNIWPLVKKHYILFQADMIKMVLSSAVCCLYSIQSEVIVAAIEFLEVAFNHPLKLMNKFDPTDFSGMLVWKPLLSTDRLSLSSRQETDNTSIRSGSIGSALDISNTDCPDFNSPLVFPDSPRYHNDGSDSDITETGGDEEIIDPLMHADLYEEVNKPESPAPSPDHNDVFSTPGKSSRIPAQPPSEVCSEGANVYIYTAATLGKLFLLSGLKGLKNDREVRISHKMLALNCLTSISNKIDLTNVTIHFDEDHQPLNEAVRFVLHEDDQLCASAVQFMVSLDKWKPTYHDNYIKVAQSLQVIRKRALLQAFVGEQKLLLNLGLVEPLLDLAKSQGSSTYFLVQITCAEFLANIEWNKLDRSLKKKYQKKCLQAYFDLVFAIDPKVSKAAVDNISKLVANADLTRFTSAFETGLPSEPLMNTGLIPAVLNLSKEYNFFNESPDYVLESNLEMILQELTTYYLKDCESRSHHYCNVIEALMETFPPTIYYEVWGGVSKNASPTPVILTTILDKCEASLASSLSLTTGLNVLSKLFAGMCEGYIVQVVREQAAIDRTSLPKLPDPPVLDRILLLALRTINMYYSLIAEHRSTLSQASTSLLNRPTMSPLLQKKPSPNRIADISHLMGTSVHPSRKSSFLDCLTLNSIFPSIQGAYTNYLESLNPEHEQKFCGLLQAAMNCLGCVCEMLSFVQLKPVLEEILLYIKVILEVAPAAASRLLHQMFKVVFGKNAANINLNCLNSLKMKDPLPPSSKDEMYYMRYANEFTTFSSLIGRKDYISSFIHRELGWLKSDMLSKIHVPVSAEIATALEPFEGFVTQLRHIYNAYQSIEFKKTVLGVMCELPRNGIIYNMADPKKILLDLVIQQTQDPSQGGNMEVLTEIVLFLIVLARTNVLKFEHIVKIGADLLEKADENNAKHVLQCIRVIVLELLYVQQVELDILYVSFNSRSKDMFNFAPDETMFIWMLILHMTDKNSQKSISIDFFGNFSEYLSIEDSVYNCSFTLATATLSMMSPSMFLPVDNFFKLLQKFIEDEFCELKRYWGRITTTIFVLLHSVDEEPLLLRLEDLVKDPLDWLTNNIVKLLVKGFNTMDDPEFPTNTFVHFLQTLVSLFKAERYKKLTIAVSNTLENAQIDKTAVLSNWSIFSQFVQLLKFSKNFKENLEQLQPNSNNNSYLHEICKVFAEESTTVPEAITVIRKDVEKIDINLFIQSNDTNIIEGVFKEEIWDKEADLYNSLLLCNSSIIYPLLSRLKTAEKTTFLAILCRTIKKKLKLAEGREALKAIILECQEYVDAIVDHIKIGKDSSEAEVLSSLTVLSHVKEVVQIERTITVSRFTAVELTKYLECAATAHLDARAIQGISFVLMSESICQHFQTNPLSDLAQIADLLSFTCCSFIKDNVKDYASGEHFIVNSPNNETSSMIIGTKSAEELIGELFNLTQHLIGYLQSGVHHIPRENNELLRILFRHPVLHSLAMVPLAAFKMQWTLQVIIRSAPLSVHVPLVNIHMLCNIDVLQDFSWRISWMGWTSRQQFEDFWMSLFGVLSSTPTGAEIADNNNVTEQILASSLAVSALTDILLYTLLFPEPGNVPIGTFVVKDREKHELFYESKTMLQLRTTLGKLRHKTPEILFTRNLERLEEQGDCYDLGQLSAMALWTLTGDLRSTKKDSPEKVKISLSEYLLKTTCELDTASSVRALFENFSHWFSRGLEFLPLPLLSATVRSMVFLSDLFDETQSYEFLYNQIKVVYRGGYLSHHSDLGYVIYALLKTVTVIGVESVERTMTEADVGKMVLSWVENGLLSKYPFVRTATLHGILYILQSMASESLKPVYQYVASFLLAELTEITSTSEANAILESSNGFSYRRLLWAVAFRLMEEPMQVNFRNNLNTVIINYYSSPYCKARTLDIVTSGVEELILHSASYVPEFLQIAAHCFKEYATMGQLFPFALRLFVTCVYREEVDPKRAQIGKFAIPLEELLSLYRRCDQKDARRISRVLVPMLLRLQSEEQTLKTIFELLTGPTLYNNTKSTLFMIYEFFQRLREGRRTSSLQELSRFAVTKSKSFFEQQGDRNHFISTVIIFASSPKEEIANKFYFVLNVPHKTLDSSSFTQLLSACHVRDGFSGLVNPDNFQDLH